MDGINENTPLGKRLLEIAGYSGISDFYITPWEPLVCQTEWGPCI